MYLFWGHSSVHCTVHLTKSWCRPQIQGSRVVGCPAREAGFTARPGPAPPGTGLTRSCTRDHGRGAAVADDDKRVTARVGAPVRRLAYTDQGPASCAWLRVTHRGERQPFTRPPPPAPPPRLTSCSCSQTANVMKCDKYASQVASVTLRGLCVYSSSEGPVRSLRHPRADPAPGPARPGFLPINIH